VKKKIGERSELGVAWGEKWRGGGFRGVNGA